MMFVRPADSLSACIALIACVTLVAPRTLLPCCADGGDRKGRAAAMAAVDECCTASVHRAGPVLSADDDPASHDGDAPANPCTGCVAPCCAKVAVPTSMSLCHFADEGNGAALSHVPAQPDAPAQDGVFHPPRLS